MITCVNMSEFYSTWSQRYFYNGACFKALFCKQSIDILFTIGMYPVRKCTLKIQNSMHMCVYKSSCYVNVRETSHDESY